MINQLNFGDLVRYDNEVWRYVGMGEDGDVLIVRGIDGHAFGVLKIETVRRDSIPSQESIELMEAAMLIMPTDNPEGSMKLINTVKEILS